MGRLSQEVASLLGRAGRRTRRNPSPASIIWSQISLGTRMACRARDLSCSDEGRTLTFVVGRGWEYIRVTLDPSDTYTVKHFRLKRRTYDIVPLHEVSDIYADNLSDVIYRMVNR